MGLRAALIVFCLAPVGAWAHAILMDSSPAAGGAVAAGAVTVELHFNSRIDRTRSLLTLTGPNKGRTSLPIADSSPPDILRTTAELPAGDYVLRWQVLAVDGHITRGNLPFTVKP